MNEGYGMATQAASSALGRVGGGLAGAQIKTQTINDQLINIRGGMRELLQQLRAISDRAGTNRINAPTAEKEVEPRPESNSMCDVVGDINGTLQRAHNVISEIQSIV